MKYLLAKQSDIPENIPELENIEFSAFEKFEQLQEFNKSLENEDLFKKVVRGRIYAM